MTTLVVNLGSSSGPGVEPGGGIGTVNRETLVGPPRSCRWGIAPFSTGSKLGRASQRTTYRWMGQVDRSQVVSHFLSWTSEKRGWFVDHLKRIR